MHWALAVLLPLAAAVLWGAFASPKAPRPEGRIPVEVLVFGGAVAALAGVDRRGLAVAFAAVAVVDGVLVRLPLVTGPATRAR